jgi:hypothetical protein
LAKHLDEVNQMKDQWPQDEKEAYKMIAHHVFMAFYDVNSSGAGGAGGAGGSSGASGSSGSSSGAESSSGTGSSSSGTSPKQ